MTYYKITNEAECHHGLQYVDGLNVDPLPFAREGSCCPGGIYFSDASHILVFLGFGPWIREVTVPEDAEMVKDPSGHKWRASKVILGERRDLQLIETWDWMVSVGVNLHVNNETPFRMAASNGSLSVVQYLAERGADIHACDDKALEKAVSNGHLSVVQYLIEKGTFIQDSISEVMAYAAQYGHLSVVQYLVEKGAEIHRYGETALRWASQEGHLSVVQYLVEKGVNSHAFVDDAWHIAHQNGHTEVAKYLKSLP